MKERPLLFSSPMVRAILAGSKTQTRRIVKAAPGEQSGWLTADGIHNFAKDGGIIKGGWQMLHPRGGPFGWIRCPYGATGDRLWVRETFLNNALEGYPPVYFYRADDEDKPHDRNWKPSIFCPRDASRITLEITAVRCERLQNISEEDAIAEGIDAFADGAGYSLPLSNGKLGAWQRNPVDAYRCLWDSINGEGAWAKNPWVWAITFRRITHE